jgi:hypothetical protein
MHCCLCAGVQAALAAYQDAAAATTAATRAALRHLSESLQAQLPAIVQCAHWSVIAQASAAYLLVLCPITDSEYGVSTMASLA